MKNKILTMFLLIIAFSAFVSGCAPKVSIETRETIQVADNDAVVSGYISEYEDMPSSVGVYLGETKDNMKKIITDTTPNGKVQSQDIDVEYDINVDGDTMLTPDTTYYYQFYARFDKKEVLGEMKSFTTLSQSIPADVTVLTGDAVDVTASGATIQGKLSQFTQKPTETGLYFGLKENEMKKVVREKNPYGQYDLEVLDVWFSLEGDAKTGLIPNTTYYYQVYAKIGNAETRGEMKSFTTATE